MNQGKLFVMFVALIVVASGYLLGFDTTVIYGAAPIIKNVFQLTGTSGELKHGLAMCALGCGALAGIALLAFFGNVFGRRKLVRWTSIPETEDKSLGKPGIILISRKPSLASNL